MQDIYLMALLKSIVKTQSDSQKLLVKIARGQASESEVLQAEESQAATDKLLQRLFEEIIPAEQNQWIEEAARSMSRAPAPSA